VSHDGLADCLWYVRRRGQVLGPFSVTELTKLRDRGNLAAFDEVSEDRASWIRYERLAELLEPKPPPEEPVAVGLAGGSYLMAPPPAPRDLRSTSLGLALLWIGHLVEMLAGLCLIVFITIVAVQGKPTAAGVVFLLWIGLSISYQIVACIGYGLASSGPPDSGPKGLPVTSLILQIVDFLLVVVLLVLLMIFGSAAQVFQAQDQVAQIAVPLLFGARMVLWIPMTIVLVEWLKVLAGRIEKTDVQARGYSRNVLSQSTYLYILYVMQNLALALAYLVHVLSDEGFAAVQRVTDKVALTFILFSVVYLMLATVVGIWRIALLFMSWRSVQEPRSPGGMRFQSSAGYPPRDVELPDPTSTASRTAARRPSEREVVTFGSSPGMRRSTKYALIFGGAGIATAVVILLIYLVIKSGERNVVAGASDEKKLAEAVGLVFCAHHVTAKNGATLDKAGSGSCFAVTPDGFLITNKHVVELEEVEQNPALKRQVARVQTSLWVFCKGVKHPAELVYKSHDFDVAVIKIDRNDGPYFKLSQTDAVERGTKVIAAGFPGSSRKAFSAEEFEKGEARKQDATKLEDIFKPRDFEYTRTDGSVSVVVDEDIKPTRKWIQHTARFSPGNSGGPLILENGVVVGINTLVTPAEVDGKKAVEAAAPFVSLSVAQLRSEIDRAVKGIRWE